MEVAAEMFTVELSIFSLNVTVIWLVLPNSLTSAACRTGPTRSRRTVRVATWLVAQPAELQTMARYWPAAVKGVVPLV